jgi:hypothetical protein
MDHKAVAAVVKVVVRMDKIVVQHQTVHLLAEEPPVIVDMDLVDPVVPVDLTVVVDVLVALVVICREILLAIPTLVVEEDIMVEDPVDLTLIQTPEQVVVVDRVCSETGHFLVPFQIHRVRVLILGVAVEKK